MLNLLWILAGLGIAGIILAHFAIAIWWARKEAALPPPPTGQGPCIRVVCGGRLRRFGGFASGPMLLFTVDPQRLGLKMRTFTGVAGGEVAIGGRHDVQITREATCVRIDERVSGMTVFIYSPSKAEQVIVCLRALGWLAPPDGEQSV